MGRGYKVHLQEKEKASRIYLLALPAQMCHNLSVIQHINVNTKLCSCQPFMEKYPPQIFRDPALPPRGGREGGSSSLITRARLARFSGRVSASERQPRGSGGAASAAATSAVGGSRSSDGRSPPSKAPSGARGYLSPPAAGSLEGLPHTFLLLDI